MAEVQTVVKVAEEV